MKKLINASCESNIRTVPKEHISLENLHFDTAAYVDDDDDDDDDYNNYQLFLRYG